MQLPNGPCDLQFPAVEKAIQEQRLVRYLPAAGGDKKAAFQFYMWNCALCQSFFYPLHFAEISVRNAIHKALLARLGDQWFDHATFRKILDPKYVRELSDAVGDENAQHGAAMTPHHVVSGLSFGFWEHLMTKRFERLLWKYGIVHNFPKAPMGTTYLEVRERIETVRRWRNRIAHHQAIFDKNPTTKYQETIELLGWICADTSQWVQSISNYSLVVGLRPADQLPKPAPQA